jgi:homocysteine S-methyltransferase
MLKPFLECIADSVLVCDGAMGTQLYTRGVFLNRCFDELNLSQPALVREVHEEYLWAGAEILETNTFGANRVKLEPHGLSERMRDINVAGVQIAREAARKRTYIAGSVGPLGIRVEPYGKLSLSEARGLFAEQIAALVEGGVDLLSLETFSDLNEIHAAILAARQVCSLPVIAQITLSDDGNSTDGTPPEVFGAQLEKWGADVVGVNCGVGPQVMLECIDRLSHSVGSFLAAQPNAGKPRNFEGRNLYLSSPEYISGYAKRFIRAGVRVVGGCCGTTPAHIKAIRDTVCAMKIAPGKPVGITAPHAAPPVEVIPVMRRSRLAHYIGERRFVTAVDMTPPPGSDPADALRAAAVLKEHGLDVIRITDAPKGSPSMGALALAVLIEREVGIETILHYTCADRTLHTIQSELLGAHAMGLHNLLLSTGDPIRVGEYFDATAVFEVDAVGATHLVTGLNNGRDMGGKSIGRPTGFYIGTSADPGAPNIDEEVRFVEQKVQAGAHFALTTPVFRPELLELFLKKIRHCRIPVIACVRLLSSYREAEFLSNEVPGSAIPEPALERLRAAGTPEREFEEGRRFARELVSAVREVVQGIEITVPAGNYDAALEILNAAARQ